MRPPGDMRCSITTSIDGPSPVHDEERKVAETDVDCAGERPSRQEGCEYDYTSSIRNLSLRSSVPAVVYQAMWPWGLCRRIYNMIKENDEFQGLSLHMAAGLCFADGDEHNDNIQATATDDDSTASSPIRFQVVDPSAFANWIASNMPLSQNDRLDLLELTCVVQQLRFILQKLEDKKTRNNTTLQTLRYCDISNEACFLIWRFRGHYRCLRQ